MLLCVQTILQSQPQSIHVCAYYSADGLWRRRPVGALVATIKTAPLFHNTERLFCFRRCDDGMRKENPFLVCTSTYSTHVFKSVGWLDLGSTSPIVNWKSWNYSSVLLYCFVYAGPAYSFQTSMFGPFLQRSRSAPHVDNCVTKPNHCRDHRTPRGDGQRCEDDQWWQTNTRDTNLINIFQLLTTTRSWLGRAFGCIVRV